MFLKIAFYLAPWEIAMFRYCAVLVGFMVASFVLAQSIAVGEAADSKKLATAGDIEYKAFARTFKDPKVTVIYVVATCHYGRTGYKLELVYDDRARDWKFYEEPPAVGAAVITYYGAAGHHAYDDAFPKSIHVHDAKGKHQVFVKTWKPDSPEGKQ